MLKVNIDERVFAVSQEKDITFVDGSPFSTDMIEYGNDKFHVLHNNKSFTVELLSLNRETKSMVIKVNNSTMNVRLQDEYDELLVQMGIDNSAGTKVNDIKAPMPGMVLNVMVENGQPIKKGDAIVVLEAMKMENILKSPADGIVSKVLVMKGDKVEKNQVMVNLD